MTAELSIVVATYNRADLLLGLLSDLSQQDLSFDEFEVVVVDDGSKQPVRARIETLALPYRLHILEQANAGQAAARDAGIRRAQGRVVIILDDDMRVAPGFLRAHLDKHREGYTLVMGHIRAAPELGTMPLFERFHARQLDAFVDEVRRGAAVRGAKLCTGNVSFRRADYLSIGGFDRSLKRSEDRDLGIRLELAGARITFSEDAYTTHRSDHTDLAVWLKRARLYGRFDSQIADKYPLVEYIDPWRFIFDVNLLSRPLLLFVTAVPSAGDALSQAAFRASQAVDKLGLTSLAIKGTTLVYGLEYFAGMRDYNGSLRKSAGAFARYLKKRFAHQSEESRALPKPGAAA